jgi:hypothetical protein
MHQASTAARLYIDKSSPPQAMPTAGVATLKGNFTANNKKNSCLVGFLGY